MRCTHGMFAVNQAQIRAVWPFLGDRPPHIVDWLPWNHVFGGSHNFNLMLANGGTLYIDHGKPTPNGFATSVANIRDKGGSIAFNVPAAYGLLIAAMERDRDLRRAFFAELDMIFYAGASLPQDMWTALERMALDERGEMPLMASSWGMTETAPAAIMVHAPITRAGLLGAPLPGVTVKLIPDAGMRCELRVKGPNVTPGYFRDPERTAAGLRRRGLPHHRRRRAPRRSRRSPRAASPSTAASPRTSSSPPAPGCMSPACASRRCRCWRRWCRTW